LIDLGIAAPVGSKPAGPVAGTPSYMAPEALDRGEIRSTVDLYALGLLLYELATGNRAFPGRVTSTPGRTERAPDPKPLAGVPGPLASVILDLLVAVPEGDADSFSRRLARLSAGLRSSTPPPMSTR
jgi:eukaryotic-like serine/threonine-protein kinase